MSTLSVLFILLLSFFFNDTATTVIYTLSLHDALPIFNGLWKRNRRYFLRVSFGGPQKGLTDGEPHPYKRTGLDRKSTRLNSSHSQISYAVICLKKKNNLSKLTDHLLTQPQTDLLHLPY